MIQQVLDFIKGLVEEFAPALAVALWDMEEDKLDHAKKEQEAAELAAKNMQDEKTIRDSHASESDADVVNDITGTDQPKPGSKP